MATWHFIIPFYFGKNTFVFKKGGAPVDQKIKYLSSTLESIRKLEVDQRITIFVCNEVSRQQALTLHSEVKMLDCHPHHLPIEAVKFFQKQSEANIPDDDIIAFNEDDQILYLADSVKNDILNTTEKVVFSPHRWARMFYFFRRKKRPILHLKGVKGILDNFDKKPQGQIFQFNHKYVAQANRDLAYAACWFMKASLFRSLDFNVPVEKIMLESPSFAVFESGLPLLKFAVDNNENIADFLVDHLSGYDYNRRVIKFRK